MIEDRPTPFQEVTDVNTGVWYWFNKLLSICLDIFDYEGLPENLPKKELETNLLLQWDGHAIVFYTVEYGLVTCWSDLYEPDIYYQPTKAVYAQPVLGSGERTIGKDCEIIYNNALGNHVFTWNTDGGLRSFISRYAVLLADIDCTIDTYIINTRAASFPVAKNDKVKQSLMTFFKNLRKGKRSVISDDTIIESFKNIDILGRSVNDRINDLLIAKDKILESFFRDLGVRFYNPKKAQVSVEEVESNTQLLVVNTSEMLSSRQEGIDRVNRHYGTNIKVKLNDKFDITNYSNMFGGGVNAGSNAEYNL